MACNHLHYRIHKGYATCCAVARRTERCNIRIKSSPRGDIPTELPAENPLKLIAPVAQQV